MAGEDLAPPLVALIAEDDEDISEPLAGAMRREGFEVTCVADGPSALETARRGCDLLILDIGLPGMDGLEVCRRLRAEGSKVPVVMLTARAGEIDTVVGLDAGADDYVTKPFRLAEFHARVRAVLRRRSEAEEGPGEGDQGGLRVDVAARRVWVDDEEVVLTAKEFDLLAILHREAGRVVEREQLMREAWQTDWVGSTKTLDMHVSGLRKKLGDCHSDPRFIATVRGVGFRLLTDG
ncbi:response regulator transcription factor [Kytococcus aerolatus]|uniref:response regulator transcription factor n=1 Tax=Kytococcus aerolatus TaxID=592308 RepID=UPI00228672D6|nr:response regulator transcription factor [Kytococcus aerolatus]